MNKMIYSHIYHKRFFPLENKFSYRGMQIKVNIKDLGTIKGLHLNRWGIFSIFTRDHAYRKDCSESISEVYRRWALERLEKYNFNTVGDIILQTIPRIFGYGFNPVSFWYCYEGEASKSKLLAIICEVNNTFGDSHNYILTHAQEGQEAKKEFHVSPFYPRQGRYQFKIKENVIIKYFSNENDTNEKLDFIATLTPYREKELSRIELIKCLVFLPFFTFQVMFLIHWQALIIFLKKATFYRRPNPFQVKDTYGTDDIISK